MKKVIISIILIFTYSRAIAGSIKQYNSARKQFILEYTVFGVDECLKSNSKALVVDESDATEGKVLVGSRPYFELLAKCFKKIKSTCTGESCIVSNSMSKRLENVRHVDLMKQRLEQKLYKMPNGKAQVLSKK